MPRDYFPLVVQATDVNTVDVARSFGAGQSFLIGYTPDSTLQSYGASPLSICTRWKTGSGQEFTFEVPVVGQSVTVVSTTAIAGPSSPLQGFGLSVSVPVRSTALVRVYGSFTGTVSALLGGNPAPIISINTNATVTTVTQPDTLVLSNLTNSPLTYDVNVVSLSSGAATLYGYQITGGTVYRYNRDDVTLTNSWSSYRTLPQRALDGVYGIAAFDPDGIYNHFAMMLGAYQTEVSADARVMRSIRDPYQVPAEYIDAAGYQIGRSIPGQLPEMTRRGILAVGPAASRARGSAESAAIEMRGIGYRAQELERWTGTANPILCFDSVALPVQTVITNPTNPLETLYSYFNPGYDQMTTNAPDRIFLSGFFGYDAYHAAQGALWLDPAFVPEDGDNIRFSDSTGANPPKTVTFGAVLSISTTDLVLPIATGYTVADHLTQIAEFLTKATEFSAVYRTVPLNIRHDDLSYTNPTASNLRYSGTKAPSAAVAATGSIVFSSQPVAGARITISDGNTRLGGVVFQLGGTVADSAVPVAIGANFAGTASNLFNAINTFVFSNPGRLNIAATYGGGGTVNLANTAVGTHGNVAFAATGVTNALFTGMSGGAGNTDVALNCPDGVSGYVYVPTNNWSAGGVSVYQINPDGSDGALVTLTPTKAVLDSLGAGYFTSTYGWATVAGYWYFSSPTGAIRIYNTATGTTSATIVALPAAAPEQYRSHGTYTEALSRFWPVSMAGVYYSKVDGSPITYPPVSTRASVTVGGQLWTEVASFSGAYPSSAFSWHYTLTTNSEGKYVVTFGDGTEGLIPKGTIAVTYYNSGGAVVTDTFTSPGTASYAATTSYAALPIGGSYTLANVDRSKASSVLNSDALPATARIREWGTLYNTETEVVGLSDDLTIVSGTPYGVLALKSGGRYLLKSGTGYIRLHA